jgi:hypothetical protein
VSEAKVEAKVVKDAFAAGYKSRRVFPCTCVRQGETKVRQKGSKQGRGKERIKEGNNEC